MTIADEIRRLNDEGLAKFLATVSQYPVYDISVALKWLKKDVMDMEINDDMIEVNE